MGSKINYSVLAFAITLFVLVAVLSSAQDAHAATAVQSGDWNNPDIWSGGVVPDSNATKVIPDGITVTITTSITNNSTIINNNNGTIMVAISGVNGIWNQFGGTITNNGTIMVAHTGGTGAGILNDGAIINNDDGTITIADTVGFGIRNFGFGSTITNNGTIMVANTGGTGIHNALGTINNDGTIMVANTGGIGINNEGTINNDGTIKLECDATYVGNDPIGNPIIDLCVGGTITIIKELTGDDATFGFTISGPSSSTPSIDTSVGNTAGLFTVEVGEYSVTESIPPGYALVGAECKVNDNPVGSTIEDGVGNISIGAGDDVVCTFTNTKLGTIIVKKVTDPPGDPQLFEFTGDAAGTISDGETIEVDLPPGTYTSTETVPDGWILTDITCDAGGSGDLDTKMATFELGAGETIECTFTNTKLGTIIVKKVTDPESDTTSFEFEATGSGMTPNEFELSHSESQIFDNLVPGVAGGVRSVNEIVPLGWLLAISCEPHSSDVTIGETGIIVNELAVGDTVECTFTNTSAAQATQNLIDEINSSALPQGVKTSLTAPLSQAVNLLEDDNPDNDVAVCGKLDAFINQVNARTKPPANKPLTQEQANALISQAEAIKTAIGCS